jgi:hypothetical protein
LIVIDGVPIDNSESISSLYIPSPLHAEKSTIKITFQAKAGNQAGPLFGVRLVKESQ